MAKKSGRNKTRHIGEPAEEATVSLPAGRNLVVTIGINDYAHWPILHNAVEDALGVHRLFVEKLGFAAPVPPLLNSDATRDTILDLVQNKLRQILQSGDCLLLFFAGHGHTRVAKVGDREIENGFIIPVDANCAAGVEVEHWNEYISADQLLSEVGLLPAHHVLLILDACRSGIALGEALQIHRGLERYKATLARPVSRKVITSARRNEDALDNGPIPGHSLFTGTLVEGLNWGTADLDRNGLVTASELGLYLQQRVGQASDSKQTPDFGAFHLDQRGEMVISLREDNFDAIKARAFGAMLRYDVCKLNALVQKLIALCAECPETLYLQYRLRMLQGDVTAAKETISRLYAVGFQDGDIPMSYGDLAALNHQLHFWQQVLGVPPGDPPIAVKVLKGRDTGELAPVPSTDFRCSDTCWGQAYEIEDGALAQFEVTNQGEIPAHLYAITLIPDGRMLVQPLLASDTYRIDGLPSGATERGARFVVKGLPGSVTETRIICSPQRISAMLFPPSTATRDVEGPDSTVIANIQTLRIFQRTPERLLPGIEIRGDQALDLNKGLPRGVLASTLDVVNAPSITKQFGDWRPCGLRGGSLIEQIKGQFGDIRMLHNNPRVQAIRSARAELSYTRSSALRLTGDAKKEDNTT